MPQNSSLRPAADAFFAPTAKAGGLAFVSMVTAPEAGPDIKSQTQAVLAALKARLEQAGSSLAQAVTVNVVMRSAADFAAMNDTYREVFADKPPTRTTVVAGLPPGALIGMSAIGAGEGTSREVMHPAGWPKSPRPYSYIVKAGDLVFSTLR